MRILKRASAPTTTQRRGDPEGQGGAILGCEGVKTAAVCASEPASASSGALRPISITYTFNHDPHRQEDSQAYTDVRAQHPPTHFSV
jgi:hypothetical protein